jgi:TonB family protein
MKHLLITIGFVTAFSVSYAQQPPPKTPKDPDIADTLKGMRADTLIFMKTEHEPEFRGGIEKLYRYLEKNLRYPAAAKENNIEGKVFVTFVVEKDGSLTDIRILKSLSPETDAEAIRLMQACPKWSPGIQNGRPVRVQYSMPVSFTFAE